ncbi:hypothetical protein CCACVL1_09525, partial [Corchorus capsularis]
SFCSKKSENQDIDLQTKLVKTADMKEKGADPYDLKQTGLPPGLFPKTHNMFRLPNPS